MKEISEASGRIKSQGSSSEIPSIRLVTSGVSKSELPPWPKPPPLCLPNNPPIRPPGPLGPRR